MKKSYVFIIFVLSLYGLRAQRRQSVIPVRRQVDRQIYSDRYSLKISNKDIANLKMIMQEMKKLRIEIQKNDKKLNAWYDRVMRPLSDKSNMLENRLSNELQKVPKVQGEKIHNAFELYIDNYRKSTLAPNINNYPNIPKTLHQIVVSIAKIRKEFDRIKKIRDSYRY